jgi:probable F420-dependent oxidoreductase
MQLGVVFSQADSGTDPDAIRSFATGAEAAGYRHLMAYDHVLGAPASMFATAIGSFPKVPYTDEHIFHEILVLFAHLSGVTTSLEFVTSVLVLPQRQTAVAAKQIATLDLLTGGRLHVSVGVGWNNVEYAALGTDFASRARRLSEQIQVMKRLWTEPLVTFTGEFHDMTNVGINPLPSHPIPVWMGTKATDAALRRVVSDADGWMPLIQPGVDPLPVGPAVVRLRELCEEAGRDPATLPVWGRIYVGDGWQARAEQAKELGFTHLSIAVNRMANPGAGLLEQLDAILAVKAELDTIVG